MILIPESGRSVAKSQGHLGNAGSNECTGTWYGWQAAHVQGLDRKTDKAPRIKKSRDRPVTQEIKIDGTPEEVARAIFSAVNPPILR